MKKLNGREIKAHFVIFFAIVPMLALFLSPIQASRNVTEAFVDDVGKNDLVGVKVGDWVKYSVSITGPVVWAGQDKYIDWIRIDVQNISDTIVTVHEMIHYKNGEIYNSDVHNATITADLRTYAVGEYSYIIATNHNIGDRILRYGEEDIFYKFFINGTVSKKYLGMNREAYYSIFSFTRPFFWDHIKGILEYYWDRETGFLLEAQYEGFFIGYENTTFSRWLWEIADTNLWETKINPQPQPVWRHLGLLAFTGAVAGAVTLVTFIKRRPKTNKKIPEV